MYLCLRQVVSLLLLLLQVSEEAATADSTAPGTKGDSFVGSLEDAVLQNANQFHKWHTELEAACASETEEKYKQYAQLLQNHLASCDKLQGQVRIGPRYPSDVHCVTWWWCWLVPDSSANARHCAVPVSTPLLCAQWV
jgi:hypothetical protein